jgi:hypothetical protein
MAAEKLPVRGEQRSQLSVLYQRWQIWCRARPLGGDPPSLRASDDPEIPCSGEILDPSTKASDGVGRCVRFLRGPFKPSTPQCPSASRLRERHRATPRPLPTRPFNLAPHVSWFPHSATRAGSEVRVGVL